MRPPNPAALRNSASDLFDTAAHFSSDALLASIGTATVLAVSGGRVWITPSGVILPVSDGWAVEVVYTPMDLYTVRRVRYRGDTRRVHGELGSVYCDQVSEAAYAASCFENGPWFPPAQTGLPGTVLSEMSDTRQEDR